MNERRNVVCFLIAFLVFGFAPCVAQNVPSAAIQVTAASALQLCSLAMGNVLPNQGFVVQAQETSAMRTDNPISVTLTSRGNQSLQIEREQSSGEEVTVVANGNGHKSLGSSTAQNLPYAATKYFHLEHLPVFSCTLPPPGQWTVTLVGTEQINGASAYDIEFTVVPQHQQGAGIEKMISDYHLYLDSTTFLPVKMKSRIFSPTNLGSSSTWETFYSDYRESNGLKVPFLIVQALRGKTVNQWQITSVVAQDVPASFFH